MSKLTHIKLVPLQIQEYVEAATLCKFCTSGALLNLDEINAALLPLSDPSFEPLQINILDYILGVFALISHEHAHAHLHIHTYPRQVYYLL